MNDVYKNINDYNPRRQAIIKELFIRCRKINISLVFITQYYLTVPKDVRLNCEDKQQKRITKYCN